MSEVVVRPEGKTRIRWSVCALLFAATSINYMDRQVLGLLKPVLQASIGFTERDYGHIVAAFQVAYAVGMLLAGRLIDRLGTRIGYVVMMGIWSLAAMGHALVSSVLGFGIARVFLGLGEAGNFPAALKTVAEWFPRKERSLATGIFNSGTNVGAVLAPAIIPWITVRYGWHAGFLTTGAFSAAWIAWWFTRYRQPKENASVGDQELQLIYAEAAEEMGPAMPWRELIRHRQLWAYAVGKFMTDPIWYFYLGWLPSFFFARYHLSLLKLGLPLIAVYNIAAIGSIGGGWLPAVFTRFGATVARARMLAMLTCACAVVPILAVTRMQSVWAAVGLLSLAASAHQGWSANLMTIPSDTFPRRTVGAVTGLGGMAGAVGGALFANYTGKLLDLTHSYVVLFYIAAGAYLAALALIRLLAPGLKPVEEL